MKALKLLVFGIVLFMAGHAQAQISINLNIGSPPKWGPVGYTDVQYYYLPDVEAYYDIPSSNFIYLERGAWVHRAYLPGRYRNYDLYHGYKVVMNDYRGNSPYTHFKEHKMKYAKGYCGRPQRNIGERERNENYNDRFSDDDDRGDRGEGNNGKGHGRGHGEGHGKGHGKDK